MGINDFEGSLFASNERVGHIRIFRWFPRLGFDAQSRLERFSALSNSRDPAAN